jgi:hypothetical protein
MNNKTCSMCSLGDETEPVVEVEDNFYLCGDCAKQQINELRRSKEVIDMLMFYLISGLPSEGI